MLSGFELYPRWVPLNVRAPQFFSIFLKTMFPLPDMNLYTSTVNIATSLVKPRKIIFF